MRINFFNKTLFPNIVSIIEKLKSYFDKNSNFKFDKINIILLTKSEIKKLNSLIFNKNNLTDVISINSEDKKLVSGDIYICPDVIRTNAKKFNTTDEKEMTRIIIHGMLHIAGLDHKNYLDPSNPKEKMFILQEKILNEIFK